MTDRATETFVVPGFRAGAAAAGVKKADGRLDVALIVADGPCPTAGVFTRNLVQAAPVVLSRERLRSGYARAILANSGNANAGTGAPGLEAARAWTALAAEALGVGSEEVLMASTGVIGLPLSVGPMERALPRLIASLAPDGFGAAARAIMTTDTVPKTFFARTEVAGVEVGLGGIGKGAGMIRPDLATMLCFLCTDARVEPKYLSRVLSRAVDASFNRITIDGDTSTNDCVFLMASGAAGNAPLAGPNDRGGPALEELVTAACRDLAHRIVADGEGATKVCRVAVIGAASAFDAQRAAFTVAESPLVKTALFGGDPNWGRILAALGRSGARFDPEDVDIFFDGVQMVAGGLGLWSNESRAAEVMRRPEMTIQIDLKAGQASFTVLTCDFSREYVSINADYRS
ncbi:MAG: bifunctional glutamate N-acetyltransferase/amino-acid acetyltransferase ArgJ [Proteobacteria bacterium]|nr:bifunctional glutamate N-acetyltransferase/amino-acid acetyltransferase ArgJ [Pseudomonadota bacterium]MBU1739957.1 bifunctional glutamate N-acetyltransferase/amino-acid acetyltransferase ArgJ [Pseudomonadota bacterium]